MKKRILIVDDNEPDIVLIEDSLEASGHDYEIIKANDGQVALEKAKSEMPDLIILDVMLPKLDGFHVCGMLKSDERFKSIPIILLTMKAATEDIQAGQDVQADAYMNKPLDPDKLHKQITKLTGE